ncbi:MAG: hypothetical protein KAG66_00520 [Methylococcales bacterium]|nr:hypothetical protein [Methylococcales bacterium]
MKQSTCGLRIPHIQIDNPPVLDKDGVTKGFVEAVMGAKLFFVNADTTRDDIDLITGNELAFFNADGSQDNVKAI